MITDGTYPIENLITPIKKKNKQNAGGKKRKQCFFERSQFRNNFLFNEGISSRIGNVPDYKDSLGEQ